MGQIHQLILDQGIEAMKAASADKHERQCVETAFAIMTDEEQRIGVMHAGFAMTALPHKHINETVWIRHGGNVKLRLESGASANNEIVGLPYGSIARMILLYLQSEAIKTHSRDVELGRSMHRWLKLMGVDTGGKNYKLVREQSKRLSLCRLTFYRETEASTQITNGSFVRESIFPASGHEEQQLSLWRDSVKLDEGFYQSLVEHPMPLREAAIRQLGARSMAIDLYIWLAYRLHRIESPTPITWAALYQQFGHGFSVFRQFRAKFREPLSLALAAYPDAHVIEDEFGVILYPSPPAVSPRKVAIGG